MSLTSTGSSTGSAESVAPSSPSTFESEIDALFGNGFDEGSADELPATDAGAPPAPSLETTSERDTESQPTDPALDAGAPPAPDAPTPAPDAPPADDPLKDAKPFTYTVNGETRTFDGIQTLGDKGAIVTPEYLTKLQQRLSERDHYYEKDQQNHQRLTASEQKYQALESLTRWHAGKNADGSDKILTGADGIEAIRTLGARSVAALQAINAALSDPEQFANLVALTQDANGQIFIAPNAATIKALTTAAELAALKAEQNVRSHIATLRPAAPTTTTPMAAPSAPTDITPEQASGVVRQAAQSLGLSGLTDDDVAFLAEQMPRYVRATTAEERVQHGERIVDQSFVKLIQRQATHRAEVAKTASAATTVANENARKLQAALGGRRATPMTPAVRTTPPAVTNDDDRLLQIERLMNGR